jgi:hypothetical protein
VASGGGGGAAAGGVRGGQGLRERSRMGSPPVRGSGVGGVTGGEDKGDVEGRRAEEAAVGSEEEEVEEEVGFKRGWAGARVERVRRGTCRVVGGCGWRCVGG